MAGPGERSADNTGADRVVGANLRLGDAMPGQLDDGEVASTDRSLDLVEPDADGRCCRRRRRLRRRGRSWLAGRHGAGRPLPPTTSTSLTTGSRPLSIHNKPAPGVRWPPADRRSAAAAAARRQLLPADRRTDALNSSFPPSPLSSPARAGRAAAAAASTPSNGRRRGSHRP